MAHDPIAVLRRQRCRRRHRHRECARRSANAAAVIAAAPGGDLPCSCGVFMRAAPLNLPPLTLKLPRPPL
jgi:hypothetical protein